MEKRDDCLETLPFTAVVAFIFVVVGASVSGGTLYKALLETENIFTANFISIPWVWYIQIAELFICAVMIYFATMMLVFAVVVNRCKRGVNSHSPRRTCIKSGRLTAACFLWSTFILSVCCILLMIVLVVPNIAWVMITSVCDHELAGVYAGPGVQRPGFHQSQIPLRPIWKESNYQREIGYGQQLASLPSAPGFMNMKSPNVFDKVTESQLSRLEIGNNDAFYYVFNLTAYGIYIEPWKYPSQSNIQETIKTQARFKIFCSAVKTAGYLFGCGLGGAFLVVLGMFLFAILMASYKTKLKSSKELTEAKHATLLRRSTENLVEH